uniref:Uncharacterized protein n=1 Tax=Glossina pallidipes TaxID=7398 RepID=A0A1A9ZGG3_GLOPL
MSEILQRSNGVIVNSGVELPPEAEFRDGCGEVVVGPFLAKVLICKGPSCIIAKDEVDGAVVELILLKARLTDVSADQRWQLVRINVAAADVIVADDVIVLQRCQQWFVVLDVYAQIFEMLGDSNNECTKEHTVIEISVYHITALWRSNHHHYHHHYRHNHYHCRHYNYHHHCFYQHHHNNYHHRLIGRAYPMGKGPQLTTNCSACKCCIVKFQRWLRWSKDVILQHFNV